MRNATRIGARNVGGTFRQSIFWSCIYARIVSFTWEGEGREALMRGGGIDDPFWLIRVQREEKAVSWRERGGRDGDADLGVTGIV